jgi:hypothetical protein
MKRIAITVIPFIFSLCIQHASLAQEKVENDSAAYAQFQFSQSDYSFGDVYQGQIVEHVFDFINNGNGPLLIQNVLTTCGCTAPEWPKNPVQPGDSGKIKITFNSVSKIGRQNKVITIRSNAKAGDYRLRISAMVLPAKKEE